MRETGYYRIKIRRYEDDPEEWIIAYWYNDSFYYWNGSNNEERFHADFGALEIDERGIKPASGHDLYVSMRNYRINNLFVKDENPITYHEEYKEPPYKVVDDEEKPLKGSDLRENI